MLSCSSAREISAAPVGALMMLFARVGSKDSSVSTFCAMRSNSLIIHRRPPLALLLPALEAALRRLSAFLGSCAQQSLCGPLTGCVQGSPLCFVAPHCSINDAPFFFAIKA